MQRAVFSIATSIERANVDRESLSVKNLVMFEKVKWPEASWNEYTTMRTSGITTNKTKNMK